MREYVTGAGGGIDALRLIDAEPGSPGPGQVLVRLRAASLNYRDLLVIAGKGIAPTPAGLVPLSDGAGEVIEVGADVTLWRVGDHVAGTFAPLWLGGEIDAHSRTMMLGGALPGVLTEYRLFREDALVELPKHLSFVQGSTLPCAALTAWNSLYGLRPVRAGETVLVLGSGGVSIFALQFAKAAGARVIATSSDDAKIMRLRALGADEAINYRSEPDWRSAVLDMTDDRGVDHVIEVGGAGTLEASMGSTRVGGIVHLIGVLAGGSFDPAKAQMNRVIVRGVFVGSREMFQEMNRAIAQCGLTPVIDTIFPFDQAPDALRYLKSGRHFGKVVIDFDD